MVDKEQPPLVRQVIFGLVAAFIIVGPLYRQVVTRPASSLQWLRGWEMYSKPYPVCVVRFVTRNETGEQSVVDRLAVLRSNAHEHRLLKDEHAVRKQAGQLCRRLGDVDLRVYSRCTSGEQGSGWVERMRAEEDLCH